MIVSGRPIWGFELLPRSFSLETAALTPKTRCRGRNLLKLLGLSLVRPVTSGHVRWSDLERTPDLSD